MTRIHWVIQENQGDSAQVRSIVEALDAEGHAAYLVRLKKGFGVPAIPDLPNDGPVVCHGPGLLARAQGHPRLASGLFFDRSTFRWSAFREGWGDSMISQDGRVMALSEAREFLRRSGSSAFVRPDEDSKLFEGGLYDAASFAPVAGHDSTPVVVATPVQIEAEWRFFIVNREVVGCSEYRRDGRSSIFGSVPHWAIERAAELASRWLPSDVYCLDLATTGDRIGIVEANCFNASRFYGAVTERIVRAVNSYMALRVSPPLH